MPTYKVTRKGAPEDEPPRVVEAPLPGSARAHVAADTLIVVKIEASEAMRLGKDGIDLEVAKSAAE